MRQHHRILAGLMVGAMLGISGVARADVDPYAAQVQHIRDLDSAGKSAEALSAAQDLLRTVQTQSGAASANTAACLLRVSGLQLEMGKAADAASSASQAVAIDQKVLGPDAPPTLEAMDYQAAALAWQKQYDQAAALLQQTLQSAQKSGLKDQQIIAWDNLATLQIQQGSYAEAEQSLTREVALCRQGTDKSALVDALRDLSLVQRQQDEYTQAEAALREAVNLANQIYPVGAPERLDASRDLAWLLIDLDQYAEANQLLSQALYDSQKTSGVDSRQTADIETDNADLATEMGDYQHAARLLSDALRAEEKLFGHNSKYLVRTLDALGEANLQAADYHLAEASFTRALAIGKATSGQEDPYLLERLASVFLAQGKFTKAEPLLDRELAAVRKIQGPSHPDTIIPMLALANLKASSKHFSEAAKLYSTALTLLDKTAGPDHSLTVSTRLRSALVAVAQGDNATATAAASAVTPVLAKSPDDINTADNLELLAILDHSLRQNDAAITAARRAAVIKDKLLVDVLSFTSEQERLAFQATTDPYSVLGTIGSAQDMAEAVLRHKGIVLDSLLEDVKAAEKSSDPAVQNIILELRDSKRKLTDLVLEHGGDPKFERQREALKKHIGEIEVTLARKGLGGQSREALQTSVAAVQERIPEHTALIEYVRYNRYVGGMQWQPSYGAVVLTHTGAPRWVHLSDASTVDALVDYYRHAVRGNPSEESMRQILTDLYARTWQPAAHVFPAGTRNVIICPDSQLNAVSFATLLTPEKKFVGEKYMLSYVASGRDLLENLKVVQKGPMVVLADPDFGLGGKAGEKRGIDETRGIKTDNTRGIGNESTRGINTDDTGTDTTRGVNTDTTGTDATRGVTTDDQTRGIGDEATRGLEDEATRGSYLDDGVLRGVNFEPLPGTAREGTMLAKKAKAWQWAPELNMGPKVTRDLLLGLHSPRILHIATHGFFLPDRHLARNTVSLIQPQSRMANPMLRSGIALTGAQATINALRTPGGSAAVNGIFTAEDVETLDLQGTWLVTLSACDTGNGEARTGEGVLGLRRGFVMCGVQNLMMTLWPVFDSTTAKMMVDFYTEAHKTDNAPLSLAEIQRHWLVKLRQEDGLVPAVTHAGPFIMSFQGPPHP
ncbi:MAG: CHAT domain-containing protein [Candidatus Xenobia bacterium]